MDISSFLTTVILLPIDLGNICKPRHMPGNYSFFFRAFATLLIHIKKLSLYLNNFIAVLYEKYLSTTNTRLPDSAIIRF